MSAPASQPATGTTRRPAWPFPFPPPREPQEGDNQARAVNTTDGATASDVALRLNWVRDGGPVQERNEAYALASCRNCHTVAIAFQVILAVGYVQVVTPVNAAAAANYACDACDTHAVAVQLYATLSREPTDAEKAALERYWAQLERIKSTLATLTAQQAYATLLAARRTILELLAHAGPSDVETRTDQSKPGVADVPASTTTEGTTTDRRQRPRRQVRRRRRR